MIQQRASSSDSSLLLTLEEISQLVSHSRDTTETLANIVRLIQRRFETDVCSVYLWQAADAQLVLGATIGLRPECVGRIRMSIHEGLTGLVAEQLAPVMVSDAFTHPRFKYFPEAGEDAYHSFLGIPLIERGALQGALVVQTADPRNFSRDEIRMLVTVGSQLAPLVGEAQFLEQMTGVANQRSCDPAPAAEPLPVHWEGVPLSPGSGIGEAYFVHQMNSVSEDAAPPSGPIAEAERLLQALQSAQAEIAELGGRLASLLGDEQGVILQGQRMILQDRRIEAELVELVNGGARAEQAVRSMLQKYAAIFEKLTNSYFQERIYDIKDVFRRVLWHLRPRLDREGASETRLVLVAEDVSVMDLLSVDPGRLAGVVAEHGGVQSHAAILARSLGIPMVSNIRLHSTLAGGRVWLAVDGTAGCVSLAREADAQAAPSVSLDVRSVEEPARGVISPNTGGPRVEANLNLPFEGAMAVAEGAAGVGLFRSEFLFLARRNLPTEEEQVRIYSNLIATLQGLPVSIRTFDLRRDKVARWSHQGAAEGDLLDWRLVLTSRPLQKLFRDQVRAILRASAGGPTRILIPFVNSSEQLDFVVETVEAARDELHREGWEHSRSVPLGIMIESAAAAQMVKTWAPQVDFFCLGTNDLVASALALDRDDAATQPLRDPLHPGVLRLIHATVTAAHYAGRPITVCGEMAADPVAARVLAALQVDALSVAATQIRAVRQAICDQSTGGLAPQLTGQRTAATVRDLMAQVRSG